MRFLVPALVLSLFAFNAFAKTPTVTPPTTPVAPQVLPADNLAPAPALGNPPADAAANAKESGKTAVLKTKNRAQKAAGAATKKRTWNAAPVTNK